MWREGRSPDRNMTACGELRRRLAAQRRMRPRLVIVPTPLGAQDPCLQFGGKFLPVQELVPQPAVERFTVGVLPRAPRGDVQRLHPLPRQPSPKGPETGSGNDFRFWLPSSISGSRVNVPRLAVWSVSGPAPTRCHRCSLRVGLRSTMAAARCADTPPMPPRPAAQPLCGSVLAVGVGTVDCPAPPHRSERARLLYRPCLGSGASN